MEVVIKEGGTIAHPEGCEVCAGHLEEYDILNSVSAVNWNGISSFNIKSIVGCRV